MTDLNHLYIFHISESPASPPPTPPIQVFWSLHCVIYRIVPDTVPSAAAVMKPADFLMLSDALGHHKQTPLVTTGPQVTPNHPDLAPNKGLRKTPPPK